MNSRQILRKLAVITILLIAQKPIQAATTADLTAANPAATTRPKVALVLSGGGARGLSHVGVLKVLEALQVPVDMVVGTSMGAVVGGAYAAGHSISELEALATKTDWAALLTDRPPRDELGYQRRLEDQRLPSRIDMGLDSSGLRAPEATLGSAALERLLRQVGSRVWQTSNTQVLPVPYRAIATDLATGELVVLDGPSLFHAMRASMAVPGVFAPLELEGKLLADGGLVRNLPVDIARRMGADIIIAVNVGTPLLPRDEVRGAIGVTQQMFNILTEQNVVRSLGELTERDVLIAPDLTGISFLDFSQAASTVQRGVTAAEAVFANPANSAKLQALRAPERFAAWLEARTQAPVSVERFEVGNVLVGRETRADKGYIAQRFGLKSGDSADNQAIELGIARLLGGSDFERVDLKVVGSGARRDIVLLPVESILGGQSLRLGLRLESDLRDTNSFSLMAQHRAPWLNALGGEWLNFVQLGATARIESDFFQPLASGSPWFVAASARYEASQLDVYNGAQQRVARARYSRLLTGLFAGYRLGNYGEVRFGAGRVDLRAEQLIPQGVVPGQRRSGPGLSFRLNIDTLDSANFATRGQLISLDINQLRSGGSNEALATLTAIKAWRLSDWALQASGEASVSSSGTVPGSLGGFLRLSGTPRQSISGERVLFVRGIAARSIGQMPTGLGGAIRVGLSLEAGKAGLSLSNASVERAISGFLAIDTRLGPIYLGAGHTFGRGSGVYVFLGKP